MSMVGRIRTFNCPPKRVFADLSLFAFAFKITISRREIQYINNIKYKQLTHNTFYGISIWWTHHVLLSMFKGYLGPKLK